MYIVFDIGGTKTRIAASRDLKNLVGEPRIEKTPSDFDTAMDMFESIAKELCLGESVDAIGGGIAGPLDKNKTMLLRSPNLSSWVRQPLVEELSKRLGAPVFLENDTAIVGLGEAYAGAGMGHDIVVYITVSTGVGGVRIINGSIAPNTQGFEPGHQIIDIDNSICEKCESGTLEDMVSGTATAKRFGVKAYEVEDERIWEEELPKWFSYGLYNTILHWSPDVVVLGGSMIVGDPAISIPQTERYTSELLKIFPKMPEIKRAELDALGGIHGALAFVRQKTK